jgi:Uma2 family endonuclease
MSILSKYRPHYTYEDYCLWEGKWELIEGMPYAMSPAPVPAHQTVNANMYVIFKEAFKNSCKKCKAYITIDWKIASDTVVEPDLLIVCDKIEKKYLDFTPFLVAEILSPSTASKDRGEKMELYQMQQVKYYIIADPKFKKLEIYQLNNSVFEPVAVDPSTFTFQFEEGCTAKVSFFDIWE